MGVRCVEVGVFRRKDGSDGGGVSGRFDTLLVACPNGPVEVHPEEGIPDNFCRIVREKSGCRNVYGIVPSDLDADGEPVDRGNCWYSFGGNFAFTEDSRFTDMILDACGAIPIWDRAE